MSFETITLERIGDVARLSINRPDKRNAVNEQVHQEMRAAVAEVTSGSDRAKALILTGTGDRAFCSGQDLSARMPPESGPPTRDLGAGLELYYNALIRRLRQVEMPVITALNGVAAGAGVGVALAGDIILAARSAKICFHSASGGVQTCRWASTSSKESPIKLPRLKAASCCSRCWGAVRTTASTRRLLALLHSSSRGLRDPSPSSTGSGHPSSSSSSSSSTSSSARAPRLDRLINSSSGV